MGNLGNLNKPFVAVTDVGDLGRLFAASAEAPVVLFKHDYACSISARAFRELAGMPGEVPLIDVERQRDVAAEVATRTGVKHESPQVIVLRDGQAVYSASLWNISSEEVIQATGAGV